MIMQRLRLFLTFFDSRWEDLNRNNWKQITYRDFSAGLIVALTAIPMSMGFAMAMGMRPEQGIIAGSLACLVGRTWGGSKYQVYGPTAAFIPLIAGLMAKYGVASGGTPEQAHGFLVLVSIIAGVVLMIMGLLGMGKYAKLVPNSIVVGFTVGIAAVIALTNIKDILGISSLKYVLVIEGDALKGLFEALNFSALDISRINIWAIAVGLGTFFLTKFLLRVSIFIPAPLISIVLATVTTATLLRDKGIAVVGDIYGSIPNNFFVFTPPIVPEMTSAVMIDIVYFVLAIVFISGVESLLCSSMADRMANNRKTLFNPDKEFWGQGLVQVIVPLVNGFPCTGALARTATSIKAGAVTPLAGFFKAVLKLALAYYIASYLEEVPMACIAGILLWVAGNMFKPAEIKEVLAHNKFHASLMIYTAIMVPLTDFLTGVLSALILYAVLFKFLDKPVHKAAHVKEAKVALPVQKVTSMGQFECVDVLLGLDGLDAELLTYAEKLANKGVSKEFHFIHIIPSQKPPASAQEIEQLKARILSEVNKYFYDSLKGISFNAQVFNADSHIDQLIEHVVTSNSDLVLLGHHHGRRRSLARRLAMVTNASVWMVPEGAGTEIKRILAPVDFSKPSADALSHATALAKMHGLTEVSALHVYFDESTIRYDEHIEAIKSHKTQAFKEFLAGIETHGIHIKPVFVESSMPEQAILEMAQEMAADLIVMSTRGRSNATAILLGDTVSQIMINSSVPVLTIKHYGDRIGLLKALFGGGQVDITSGKFAFSAKET